MPRALKKTAKSAKSVKTAKTARRVIKPWTKEDVRMLKAHSKARTPVTKLSKVMKRTVGALRRRAGILGAGLGHLGLPSTTELPSSAAYSAISLRGVVLTHASGGGWGRCHVIETTTRSGIWCGQLQAAATTECAASGMSESFLPLAASSTASAPLP